MSDLRPSGQLEAVRAVTIDAAGTLLRPYPSVGATYAEVLRKRGVPAEDGEMEARFRRAFTEARSSRTTFIGEERAFWREVVRLSVEGLCPEGELDAVFTELWELYATGEVWKPAEGATEVLSLLRKRGLRLALLSNNDSRVRNVLDDLRLSACFDHLLLSSEVGLEKPDAAFFRKAEQLLEVEAGQALHVGDGLEPDVKGALAAGWRAAWFAPNGKGEEAPPGASVLRSFSELPGLLA